MPRYLGLGGFGGDSGVVQCSLYGWYHFAKQIFGTTVKTINVGKEFDMFCFVVILLS